MSDTPETDDLARGNHVVPTEFAQELERERNWFRGMAETLLERNAKQAVEIVRLKGALQDIAALDTSQDAGPQQCAAVLLAMNALDQ
jgi:hypothetical protein